MCVLFVRAILCNSSVSQCSFYFYPDHVGVNVEITQVCLSLCYCAVSKFITATGRRIVVVIAAASPHHPRVFHLHIHDILTIYIQHLVRNCSFFLSDIRIRVCSTVNACKRLFFVVHYTSVSWDVSKIANFSCVMLNLTFLCDRDVFDENFICGKTFVHLSWID